MTMGYELRLAGEHNGQQIANNTYLVLTWFEYYF